MELEIADPRLLRRRRNWVIHHLIEYCERGGGCYAVVGIVVQWWLQIFDYLHFFAASKYTLKIHSLIYQNTNVVFLLRGKNVVF